MTADVVWVRDEGVVVFDDDGRPLYLQGYLLDITAEREAQEQLRQLALYDALTGLANRAFFHEQFQHTLSIRKEPRQQTALLFLDLNDFKNVNDRWGHDVGDAVLAHTRRADPGHAARRRLGGAARRRRVRDRRSPRSPSPRRRSRWPSACSRRFARRSSSTGGSSRVGASIGISVGCDAQVMLQEADAAMYRAKRQQDVGYAFFDPELDIAAVQRSRRVIELREAVELGQFTLDYQPVIDLEAYEISGYEALLRWQHPTEGPRSRRSSSSRSPRSRA